MPTRKNHPTYDSSFRAAGKESQAGVAKPRSGKNSKAPAGNAMNSARPANPGGLSVLNKLRADGSFKTDK